MLRLDRDLHRYATRFGFDRVAYVQSLGAYFSDRADGAIGATRWTPVSIISAETTSSVAIVDLPAHCPIGRHCLTHDKPFAWKYSDERFFKPDPGQCTPHHVRRQVHAPFPRRRRRHDTAAFAAGSRRHRELAHQ